MKKIESKNPGRIHIILTDTDGVPTRKLSELIREFTDVLEFKKITSADAFFGIQEISSDMEMFKLQALDRFSLFGIATGMYAATSVLRDYPIPRQEDGYRASRRNAEIVIKAAEGVVEDDYAEALKDKANPKKRELALLNLAQTICENSIYQMDIIFKVATSLVITGNSGFRNLPKNSEPSDKIFQEHLGLSSYEYLFYLFAIWIISHRNGIIDTNNVLAKSSDQENQLPKLKRVLAELSKKTTEVTYPMPGFEYSGKALPLALFSRYPLIRIDEHLYIVSNANFAQLQFTSKYLTKGLALARQSEGKASTTYSHYLGKVRFEGFFKELCDVWNPSGGHFDEYFYDNRNEDRSPDRVAFERHGSRSICNLFQIKLKMLREATHFGTALPSLDGDIGPFSEMIVASMNFLGNLEHAQSHARFRSDSAALSQRILSADTFCFVGVSPDLPPIFVIKDFREKLFASAEAKLSENGRRWLDKNRKRLIWHVIDISEFQTFLTLEERDRRFFKHISDYLRISQIDRQLMDGRGSLPASFGSYLSARFSMRSQTWKARRFEKGLSELKGIFDDFNREMARYFFSTEYDESQLLDEIT